jgi:hypothetical protein
MKRGSAFSPAPHIISATHYLAKLLKPGAFRASCFRSAPLLVQKEASALQGGQPGLPRLWGRLAGPLLYRAALLTPRVSSRFKLSGFVSYLRYFQLLVGGGLRLAMQLAMNASHAPGR